jgi:hypothetical protein
MTANADGNYDQDTIVQVQGSDGAWLDVVTTDRYEARRQVLVSLARDGVLTRAVALEGAALVVNTEGEFAE